MVASMMVALATACCGQWVGTGWARPVQPRPGRARQGEVGSSYVKWSIEGPRLQERDEGTN